jgi:hypothetical protein
MTFFHRVGVLAFIALAGCSKPLEVRIMPDAYHVGNVKSALATPAVDEVVRIKPSKVVMVACLTTRPAKIFQFETELRARLPAEILLATTANQGCPNA